MQFDLPGASLPCNVVDAHCGHLLGPRRRSNDLSSVQAAKVSRTSAPLEAAGLPRRRNSSGAARRSVRRQLSPAGHSRAALLQAFRELVT